MSKIESENLNKYELKTIDQFDLQSVLGEKHTSALQGKFDAILNRIDTISANNEKIVEIEKQIDSRRDSKDRTKVILGKENDVKRSIDQRQEQMESNFKEVKLASKDLIKFINIIGDEKQKQAVANLFLSKAVEKNLDKRRLIDPMVMRNWDDRGYISRYVAEEVSLENQFDSMVSELDKANILQSEKQEFQNKVTATQENKMDYFRLQAQESIEQEYYDLKNEIGDKLKNPPYNIENSTIDINKKINENIDKNKNQSAPKLRKEGMFSKQNANVAGAAAVVTLGISVASLAFAPVFLLSIPVVAAATFGALAVKNKITGNKVISTKEFRNDTKDLKDDLLKIKTSHSKKIEGLKEELENAELSKEDKEKIRKEIRQEQKSHKKAIKDLIEIVEKKEENIKQEVGLINYINDKKSIKMPGKAMFRFEGLKDPREEYYKQKLKQIKKFNQVKEGSVKEGNINGQEKTNSIKHFSEKDQAVLKEIENSVVTSQSNLKNSEGRVRSLSNNQVKVLSK